MMWNLGDLVSAQDIAIRAGVTVAAVSNWLVRHPSFPEPLLTLSGIRVYSWSAVEFWLKQTGRASRYRRR